MARTSEARTTKTNKKNRKGEIRSDRETRFTIGDTLGEGRGKQEPEDVEPSEMEKRGRSKRSALSYSKYKQGLEGGEPGRLVSPEANDL